MRFTFEYHMGLTMQMLRLPINVGATGEMDEEMSCKEVNDRF